MIFPNKTNINRYSGRKNDAPLNAHPVARNSKYETDKSLATPYIITNKMALILGLLWTVVRLPIGIRIYIKRQKTTRGSSCAMSAWFPLHVPALLLAPWQIIQRDLGTFLDRVRSIIVWI